jgi:hypothetical protein
VGGCPGVLDGPYDRLAGHGGEVPVVSSATPYACGLACLESLARERGAAFDHAAFIMEQGSRFPGWDRMPGVTRLDISQVGGIWTLRWDLYDLARELGLARSLSEFRTRPPLEAFLGRVGSSAFAVLKRYPEADDGFTHAHAVRIVRSEGPDLAVMDPGRRLPGRIRELCWEEFRGWEPRVFGMS